MNWQVFRTYDDPPAKPFAETPRSFLTRLDRWSQKKVAALRKERALQGKKYKLRRRWRDYALVVEITTDDEQLLAGLSVGYLPPS